MKLVIVYNTKSGHRFSSAELRNKCEIHKIEIIKLIPFNDRTARIVAPYIKTHQKIAVVGGDGTISSIAHLIVGTRAILVPLPGGTLNHFTKDLGIPQDIDKALVRLKSSGIRTIDVGSVNGISFVNNASIGIYAASLRTREVLKGTHGKWLAMIFGAGRALFRFRIYHVTINGRKVRTPFVFVGNNQYELNVLGFVDRKVLNKGVLGTVIAKTSSRFHTFKVGLKILFGAISTAKEFETLTNETLIIESKHSHLNVSHDGEVSTLATPLRFEIKKQQLRIL